MDHRSHLMNPRPPMRKPPTPSHPPHAPAAARVVKAYRVHPLTARAIDDRAKDRDMSQGQYLDLIVGAFHPELKKP